MAASFAKKVLFLAGLVIRSDNTSCSDVGFGVVDDLEVACITGNSSNASSIRMRILWLLRISCA